ncbi:hypothetical protein [Geminisphaera colitermitum]|uniref:hypothetical protein n=1 Tax=Geminisphaera colitermitum TaxID=1148786 RepID=UPI0012FF1B3A|nr:hypothetical protein [Geminisphaera colitermitum]
MKTIQPFERENSTGSHADIKIDSCIGNCLSKQRGTPLTKCHSGLTLSGCFITASVYILGIGIYGTAFVRVVRWLWLD